MQLEYGLSMPMSGLCPGPALKFTGFTVQHILNAGMVS